MDSYHDVCKWGLVDAEIEWIYVLRSGEISTNFFNHWRTECCFTCFLKRAQKKCWTRMVTPCKTCIKRRNASHFTLIFVGIFRSDIKHGIFLCFFLSAMKINLQGLSSMDSQSRTASSLSLPSMSLLYTEKETHFIWFLAYWKSIRTITIVGLYLLSIEKIFMK